MQVYHSIDYIKSVTLNFARKNTIILQIVPWGLREILRFIKEKYNNPPVFITENGYCSESRELNDVDRINYFRVRFIFVYCMQVDCTRVIGRKY